MEMLITRDTSLERLCRICLCEKENMVSLLTKTEDHQTLGELLNYIANICLKIGENEPKQICNECQESVKQFYSFKNKIIHSEIKLKAINTNNLNRNPHTEKFDHNLYKIKSEATLSQQISSLSNEQFTDVASLKKHIVSAHERIPPEHPSFVDINILSQTSLSEFEPSKFEQIELKIEDEGETCDDLCYNSVDSSDFDIQTSANYSQLDTKVLTLEPNNLEPTKNIKKQKKSHICIECDIEFKSKYKLKQHRVLNHIKKTDELETKGHYQCCHCSSVFSKKSKLTIHLQKHEKSAQPHICNTCKREFQHKAHLDNHILNLHSIENGFICKMCNETFPTKENLDIHKNSHLASKKHQCSLCPKSFSMPSSLKDHLRVHTQEKPFLCPTCGKGFTQNTNLLDHIRRHQGIKPFKCQTCGRGFVSKGELSAHSRTHTGAHPFICGECGGRFTTSSSLVKHRRLHTGERPYRCDLCPMAFAASGTLKNHRRTHTGDRPHRCPHCEKAFVQRQDLTAHIRCHTGQRPYVCSNCGQAFRQNSALKTHQKLHQKSFDKAMAVNDQVI